MKVTRFYATPENGSRFQEIDIPIVHQRSDQQGDTIRMSNSWPSPNVTFVELPAGLDESWHHAPARQIVVVLSGTIEVGTSDNEIRRCTAGQAFIADDLSGKGHLTKVLGGPAYVMFVELPQNFDVDRWAS
jgi:quercetin dioxygenase-like cupin family protein